LSPRTGFLPEPLPVAEVDPSRIEREKSNITNDAETSVVTLMRRGSPLFEDYKRDIFLAQCESLSVEQAYGRFNSVFDVGIKKAAFAIPSEEIRKIAEAIGRDATPGAVEETIAESRLFIRWLRDVVTSIAEKHFDFGKPTVVISVPHLDVPTEESDSAQLVLHYPSVWDEDEETYKMKTYIRNITWPGRHVIKEVWIDYVLILMRVICSLDD
jgi:hypothetical protein